MFGCYDGDGGYYESGSYNIGSVWTAAKVRAAPVRAVPDSASVAASWPRTRARTLKAGCAADRATNDGEAGDWVDERGAGKEKAKVGSLQLRRLVSGVYWSLDAEAPESVGASQRLAWMLLSGVHSNLDVQIKIGSGCVLRTRQ